ncbi:alpha/beta-hydrolase [Gonapodya prolifera JEL478]|uniref:Alpha/beta-hydrolase n=1 Tax=Gonapodya prolifera (strain JEL478) TaxID=1344416 RepID=A0A138ZY29_GONPJ|nr:alpha/beta-hydrolase [Gonapodya prolifera JEL478]|eukprot:KXS09185.1 alpha/beta-hydrolase [Gonapodya prolifera JEL478]
MAAPNAGDSQDLHPQDSVNDPTLHSSFLWSWWNPTNQAKARQSQDQLLSRLQFFTSHLGGSSSPQAVASVAQNSANPSALPNAPPASVSASTTNQATHQTHSKNAVIRLVDISRDPQFKGCYINTLVIDDASPGKVSTPSTPPRLLSELNAELQDKGPDPTSHPSPIARAESKVSITDFQDAAAAPDTDTTPPPAAGSQPITTAAGGRLVAKYQKAVFAGTPETQEKRTFVMAHGYGAALGFFYRNFYGLSLLDGYRIMAFDWLGMGNSSRPPFPKNNDPQKAEQWFVDSLEAWRQASNIDKMVLCGHSLGGYLSAAYALQHPDRVSKLILVSPVGVPPLPPEFQLPGWIRTLWSWNFTPHGIRYTDRRFNFLDDADGKDMKQYLYHTMALRGSGEYALGSILLPGAFAKRPLADRLAGLKVPCTFVYGSHDWMDYRHALGVADSIPGLVKIVRVPEAGHHLYLDNPPAFNEVILAEMLEEKGVKVKREDLSKGVRVWNKGEPESLLGVSGDERRMGW